jgi:hypothetical protein
VDTHPPLPNIRLIVPQHSMSYTDSALITPCRQTIEGQDSESPLLTSGSRPPSVSVCNMSIFGAPPGITDSYSTGNSSTGSTEQSTDTNRLGVSPGGESQVASSNMSRGVGRKPGVDKGTSGTINVIILRDVLQDNWWEVSLVGGPEKPLNSGFSRALGWSLCKGIPSLRSHSRPQFQNLSSTTIRKLRSRSKTHDFFLFFHIEKAKSRPVFWYHFSSSV